MKNKAFTLVELLVVISIIALLLAIMMPALSRARQAGQEVVCLTNVKGIVTAACAYAVDNGDRIPMNGKRSVADSLWSTGGGDYCGYAPYYEVRLASYLGANNASYSKLGTDTYWVGATAAQEIKKLKSVFKIFSCPSVTASFASRTKYLENVNGLVPRTYRINAHLSGKDLGEDGVGTTAEYKQAYKDSTKMQNISRLSQTILLVDTAQVATTGSAEFFGIGVGYGSEARYWSDIAPAHRVKKLGGIIPGTTIYKTSGKSGLGFVDGHAENLSKKLTMANRYPQNWETDPDPIKGFKFSAKYNW